LPTPFKYFAWRTLIVDELVLGVSSGSGGIGVSMDSLFRLLEQRTVNRWGMKF
jgi:hypothetical protein